jgi:hypothetical protein
MLSHHRACSCRSRAQRSGEPSPSRKEFHIQTLQYQLCSLIPPHGAFKRIIISLANISLTRASHLTAAFTFNGWSDKLATRPPGRLISSYAFVPKMRVAGKTAVH